MRSEAYKLSGFTIVISAVGFLLRWLQDMQIQDPENGLAAYAPISFLVVGVILVAVAGLVGFVFHLRQFDAPVRPEEAFAGHTPFYGVLSLVPALLLAVAGAYRIVDPPDSLWPAMHRICGAATLLGALGAGVLAMNITKPEQDGARRKGTMLLLLFVAVWLVTGYRDAATDPIVWRFVMGILAECVVLLAIYYTAGYFFNSAHPWWTLVTCDLGAVLCIMSAIDENGIAQSVTLSAMAAQLLIWSFVVTENLKTKPLVPESPEEK